jgi:hypothetical protein
MTITTSHNRIVDSIVSRELEALSWLLSQWKVAFRVKTYMTVTCFAHFESESSDRFKA